MTIKEMREQRAKLIHDARAMLDEVDKTEGRRWTEEEEATYSVMLDDADGIRKQYERAERQVELFALRPKSYEVKMQRACNDDHQHQVSNVNHRDPVKRDRLHSGKFRLRIKIHAQRTRRKDHI